MFGRKVVPVGGEVLALAIIVDPSQATGKWSLVRPMALAAVAAGAHGLIVEVHPTPNQALSDGAQSLDFDSFDRLMQDLRRLLGSLAKQPAQAGHPRMPAGAFAPPPPIL